MRKKPLNIIKPKIPAFFGAAILVAVWQLISWLQPVPAHLLPGPAAVALALWQERGFLWNHAGISLQEAFCGLACGVTLGVLLAGIMDRFPLLGKVFSPILVVTQTVPTVAVAPLLVLWFGYGMLPKILLILLTTFFPVTVALMEGFSDADADAVNLLRSMGAGKWQIFCHIKWPGALPRFFAGLKIAAAYSVVGAVISEWLGGFGGLGVYMTRVRKAFAFDKMFGVILLISVLSLLLMAAVETAEKLCLPYRKEKEK